MIRKLFVLIAILVLLVACTSATELPTAAPATETPVSCQPSKIQESQSGFGEIQGEMQSGGELWALLFFQRAYVNEEAKIVWRITGEGGEFEAQAQSESGTIIRPVWEAYHDSSTWKRPGLEWGTGFNFPAPGCWRITVTHGETKGRISLDVLGS